MEKRTDFDQKDGLLGKEDKWNAEEDILLRKMGKGPSQDAAEAVLGADSRNVWNRMVRRRLMKRRRAYRLRPRHTPFCWIHARKWGACLSSL